MRIAHIILVDRNPIQIVRLVRRIYHRNADIFIHIDRSCPVSEYAEVIQFKNVRRVASGRDLGVTGFDRVEAMLDSMQSVMESDKEYDYVHFMSGEDYPLQTPDRFFEYLEEHGEVEFMITQPAGEPAAARTQAPVERTLWQRFFHLISAGGKIPDGFMIRTGPQEMTLTSLAVLYILKFVSDNPGLVRYFRRLDRPGECFFQTILYNSPFRTRMSNELFHYAEEAGNDTVPATLTIKDKDKLLASGRFFARKFDIAVDAAILDVLDNRMLSYSLIK